MGSQVKIVGWIYIILGVTSFLSALCASAVIFGGGLIYGNETAITTTGITALVILAFSFMFSIPGLLAGIGLLKIKGWARILAMILAILSLPAFPIGTALGIYVLYVMFDSDTRLYFNNPIIDY